MPSPKKNKFIALLCLTAILVFVACFIYLVNIKGENKVITNETAESSFSGTVENKTGSKVITVEKPIAQTTAPVSQKPDIPKHDSNSIPEKFSVNVPFMSQAPLYVWDALHEDACEEASILMLSHYLKKQNIDSRNSFEEEIQSMINYENTNNYDLSITLSELSKLASDYLHLDSLTVKKLNSIDELKMVIYNNGPIVVGAAGKELHNPNFRNGGPNYHMLVITGYSKNGFITNDPGTRKGQNYFYNNNVLFEAIHDWNPEEITKGEKNVLYKTK